MANRSYLYSLANRPASYADRPETISGLSEWAYDVPFMYRVLMSGEPQLCASLVSDGFNGEEADSKTPLHAIGSRFDPGFARVQRFADIVRASATPAVSAVAAPASFMGRLKGLFSAQPAATAPPGPAPSAQLLAALDESIAFLEAHRDSHLLLETIELDVMSEEGGDALKACVEREIARCLHVGAAIDALPADMAEAGLALRRAAAEQCPAPLDAFFGLRLDDRFDSTRSGATEHPLGLQWSQVLYFDLPTRAEFEAAGG